MPNDTDNPPKTNAKWDYATFAKRCLMGNNGGFGQWFPKPTAFLRVGFSAAESDVLLHLINWGKLHGDPEHGWVMATESFLRDGLALSPAEQQDIINSLIGRGVMQMKYLGRLRHLRVNVMRLIEMLHQAPTRIKTAC